MISRGLSLILITFSLCQCQSKKTTAEEPQGARIGGEDALAAKFAGNWDPSDASWGTVTGETDPKKKAENQKKSRRSQFEKSVTKSRGNVLFSKETQWQGQSYTHKAFSTGPEKKNRIWPWRDKTATTKQNNMVKTDPAQNQISSDAGVAAREHSLESPDSDSKYTTDTYSTERYGGAQRRFTKAEDPSVHRSPDIIQDRNEASKKKDGLSILDVRKLLNK